MAQIEVVEAGPEDRVGVAEVGVLRQPGIRVVGRQPVWDPGEGWRDCPIIDRARLGAIATQIAAALSNLSTARATLVELQKRFATYDQGVGAILQNMNRLVLAKQAAREQGAKEAWFVDQAGRVTEGSSTNAWIVTAGKRLVTRPLSHSTGGQS